NEIFADMENCVVIYIDDLLIFTKSDDEAEHDKIVQEVLRRLQERDLFVKPEKCNFKVKEVDFLGMIIGQNGIRMNPEKVQAILEWPEPTRVKGVRAFLGLGNFYRRFIENFAKITRPLNDLTKKDLVWQWGAKEQEAFDKLKQAFTTAPILAFPELDKEFRLETDSSDFATGAVLSIKCPDDLWRPCAYLSHSLSPTERNYQIYDKEMLAIIRALEHWRHYLEGARHQFEIWTDHKNLEYFMTAR
ncbi:hypothetical protein SERLA73DRAFT_24707, partial [Serpula lacrymans var. lacrymans S7.3]